MKFVIALCIVAASAVGCSKRETAEVRLINQIKPSSSVIPASAPEASGQAALIDQIKPSRSFK